MDRLPASSASLCDLDAVSGLVQRGGLYVAVDGVWVSPEVFFENGLVVLRADLSDATDESD